MSEKVTANYLRKRWLENAEEIMDEYLDYLRTGTRGKRDIPLLKEYIDSIIPIIQKADDPVPRVDLTRGDMQRRVNRILRKVSRGQLTPTEGRKLIELLQAGFEITELPRLIEKLEEMGIEK